MAVKLSKKARSRKKLMTQAEMKKIRAAARTLFDFDLLTPSRMDMIARNFK